MIADLSENETAFTNKEVINLVGGEIVDEQTYHNCIQNLFSFASNMLPLNFNVGEDLKHLVGLISQSGILYSAHSKPEIVLSPMKLSLTNWNERDFLVIESTCEIAGKENLSSALGSVGTLIREPKYNFQETAKNIYIQTLYDLKLEGSLACFLDQQDMIDL